MWTLEFSKFFNCLENPTRIDFLCQKVFVFWNFLTMVVVLFACHLLVFYYIKFFLFHHCRITREFFCGLHGFRVCEKLNELWMKTILEFQMRTKTTYNGYNVEREKDFANWMYIPTLCTHVTLHGKLKNHSIVIAFGIDKIKLPLM